MREPDARSGAGTRASIVFESMFGNTERLAEAVARGLEDVGATTVVRRVGDPADHDLRDCDLLVLAAPTHALTLSTSGSRRDAVARGADPQQAGSGLREWIDAWPADPDPGGPSGRHLPPVAVFDTRARLARHWPGSAAHHAARVLRRRGFDVAHVTSFYVEDVAGPVVAGDVERAREWGRTLAPARRSGVRR